MRVKICGLTSPGAVRAAVDSGADAVGLVFADSPRRVSPDLAAKLLSVLPKRIEKIAVFRRPTPKALEAVASLPFDAVQAWAGWDPSGLNVRFLPVFPDDWDVADRVERWLFGVRPEAPKLGEVVLDGPGGGGYGERVDWERAAAVARRIPTVLAGGLTPENVALAIARVRPAAVDVSSGVEVRPGVKDPERVAAFVAAARGAE